MSDPQLILAAKYADAGLHAQAWDLVRDRALSADAPADQIATFAELALGAADHAAVLALTDRALAAGVMTAAAWNNLGLAREALGDRAGADAAFAQAVAIDPALVAAHVNRAALYADMGQFAAAARACEHALAIDAHHLPARVNLATALIEQGRHGEAADALSPVAADPRAADAALYLMHYCSNDPAAAMRAHAGWGARAPSPAPLPRAPGTNRRQRIGYLGPDFRQHSVSYFVAPLLAAHDRTRVEVFCYPTGGAADAVTARLRCHADHWYDLAGLDDDAACALIRGHGLDVLVDLAGHTKGNRLGIFARRAAPVQATMIGYPGTTGLAQIDYRLCDAITDPAGTDAFASERLLRLPRLHSYQPDAAAPPISALPAAAAGYVTFGSFNKLGKVSDATVALWSDVLQAVPGARLFLKSKALAEAETRALTIARFGARGIAPERLTLFGWVPHDQGHLATYGRVDIALDTFPYSGTTTTCEALWMGVPVLTLAGATHASRVSASLLTNVGLTAWIAESAEDYVAKAVAIAGDLAALGEMRTNLRERMAQSPLCDGASYAAAVEAAYRAM